jgi:lysozyme
LAAADVAGLDFVFVRASNWSGGDMGADADFENNWQVVNRAGVVRGAYWFFEPNLNPVTQARRFVQIVKTHGLKAGDILVCDSETPAANVDNVTKGFCDEVARLAGPHVGVWIYTNQNVGRHLTSCTKYPLWLAWPSAVAPGPAETDPWKTWIAWQSGITNGVDADEWNGDAAAAVAYVKGLLPKPAAPTPVWKEDTMPSLMKSGVGSITPVALPKGATKIVLVAEDTATVGVQIHNHGTTNHPITWSGGSATIDVPDNVQAVHLHMLAATGDVSFAIE